MLWQWHFGWGDCWSCTQVAEQHSQKHHRDKRLLKFSFIFLMIYYTYFKWLTTAFCWVSIIIIIIKFFYYYSFFFFLCVKDKRYKMDWSITSLAVQTQKWVQTFWDVSWSDTLFLFMMNTQHVSLTMGQFTAVYYSFFVCCTIFSPLFKIRVEKKTLFYFVSISLLFLQLIFRIILLLTI